jgi:hypothetical protein
VRLRGGLLGFLLLGSAGSRRCGRRAFGCSQSSLSLALRGSLGPIHRGRMLPLPLLGLLGLVVQLSEEPTTSHPQAPF